MVLVFSLFNASYSYILLLHVYEGLNNKLSRAIFVTFYKMSEEYDQEIVLNLNDNEDLDEKFGKKLMEKELPFFIVNEGRDDLLPRMLFFGYCLDTLSNFNQNLLHFATNFRSKTGTICLLTSLGLNINQQDQIGNTPLHYASSFCDIESISILLQKGANKNILNADGKSAIDIIGSDLYCDIGNFRECLNLLK